MARPLVLSLALVVAALATPPAASAGVAPIGNDAAYGPVLAGENAVWADEDLDHGGPLRIHVTTPDGFDHVALALPRAPSDQCAPEVEGLAASPGRVAATLVTGRSVVPGGCMGGTRRVFAGTTDGALEPLAPARPGCIPQTAALRGDTLIELDSDDCGLFERDLAAGGSATPVPWHDAQLRPSAPYARVSASGRYVAWAAVEPSANGTSAWIVVYDLVAQREAYRVDLSNRLPGWVANWSMNFAVEADGRIAATIPDYDNDATTARLYAASPHEPYPHELPLKPTIGVSLADGLVAVRRADYRDFAIADVAGNVLQSFDFDGRDTGVLLDAIAFDGRRVAWFEAGLLHNEPYPVAPAAVAPGGIARVAPDGVASIPVWCPTATGSCAGTVSLSASAPAAASAARVARTRFRIPARRERVVHVRVSAATRRTLARRGRASVQSRVVVAGRHSTRLVVLESRRRR